MVVEIVGIIVYRRMVEIDEIIWCLIRNFYLVGVALLQFFVRFFSLDRLKPGAKKGRFEY